MNHLAEYNIPLFFAPEKFIKIICLFVKFSLHLHYLTKSNPTLCLT